MVRSKPAEVSMRLSNFMMTATLGPGIKVWRRQFDNHGIVVLVYM